MNRKTWSGNFRAQPRGARGWLLSATGAVPVEVHLTGVDLPADAGPAVLTAAPIERIDVDWSGDGAVVTLSQAGAIRRLTARAAFVLEPRPELYRDLPLERFGPKSQTFWKRIFLLVRIPGGRLLLQYIARRARA